MVSSNSVVPLPPGEEGKLLIHRTSDNSKEHINSTVEIRVETPTVHLDDDNGKTRAVRRCDGWSRRSASLYWAEKIIFLINYGQLFSLFWAYGRSWPFPTYFRDNTRWTSWINIDIPSAYTWQIDEQIPELRGSEYGEITNYWIIAVVWAGIPVLLLLSYLVLLSIGWRNYWDMRLVRRYTKDICVVLTILLQVPAGVALARLYVCAEVGTSGVYKLAVDPSMTCFEAQHLIVAALCLPTTLFVLVGFPLWLVFHVRRLLIFEHRYEHERYLRWKEAEYVHDLSFDWRRDQMWLFSSYVRNHLHPYDRALWMFSMTALIVTFAYGRPSPAIMADIYFAIAVLWSLRQGVSPAYRCGTTNVISLLFHAGVSVYSFWGVMRAHGLTNSLTVDSIWTRTMMIINGSLLAVLLLCLVLSALPVFGWPTGYIGPTLWRKLMQEELQAEKAALTTKGKTHGYHSLRGAISGTDLRTHDLQRFTSRTGEFFQGTFTARHDPQASGLRAASKDDMTQMVPAEHVAVDVGGPSQVSSDVQALEQKQNALVISERDEVPNRRVSLVGGGLEPADLDDLLAQREREYELRQTYGDVVAEQMILAEHTKNFQWDDIPVNAATTARKRVRVAEEEAIPVNGPAPLARAANLGVGIDDDEDDGSKASVPLELRQLTAAEVSALEAVWVELIKRAREVHKQNLHLPPEIVNVPELRRRAKQLKREYRRAHLCRHVLAWTLEETIDDLGALADACQSRTVFPNRQLEELLHYLKVRLDQRDRDYALTSVKRKNVAFKLFALACWMKGRRIARLRIPGVNDAFFADLLSPKHVRDELTMYAHIDNIFKDVSALEISMMGLNDLREVVQDVIPARLRVDLAPAGIDALDIDSPDHLTQCRECELHEDTFDMLLAAYERLGELRVSRNFAGADDETNNAQLDQCEARVKRWLYGLVPETAEEHGIYSFPAEKKKSQPTLAAARSHVSFAGMEPAVSSRLRPGRSLSEEGAEEDVHTIVERGGTSIRNLQLSARDLLGSNTQWGSASSSGVGPQARTVPELSRSIAEGIEEEKEYFEETPTAAGFSDRTGATTAPGRTTDQVSSTPSGKTADETDDEYYDRKHADSADYKND